MRLINMTPPKIAEYFKKNDIVLLGTGSLEIHGSHNPVGVDTLIPGKILDLIEKKSDVLIAPTLPYGNADAQLGFPGTISIGYDILYATVNKIVESLYGFGARRIIFINGHGGNISALERVGAEWYKKGLLSTNISWWTLLSGLNPEWSAGHGCVMETSGVMCVDPSLVDLSAVKEMDLKNDLGDELPTTYVHSVKCKNFDIGVNRPWINQTGNGWFGRIDFHHPKNSSAKLGEEVLTAVSDFLVDFIDAFKRAKLPPKTE